MKKKRIWLLIVIPVAACLLLGSIFANLLVNQFTGADVAAVLSSNPVLAVLEIWGLCILKACSLMFPLAAIEMASGMLFPFPAAVCINLVGMCLTIAIPFLLGKVTAPELQEKIIERFPKLQKVADYQEHNQFMYCFLLRVVCVVPGDVLSWYQGTSGLDFWPFLIGTTLGKFTGMFMYTMLGANLTSGAGLWFWLLWLGLVAVNYFFLKCVERLAKKRLMKKEK